MTQSTPLPHFAIVGGGRWAAVHRQALQHLGCPLDWVCTSSPQSAQALGRSWNVRATSILHDVLQSDVDAVIVASPNDRHAPQALACLQAGKHVLVEKPMALTVADAIALRDAAKRAGRVLAAGMQMRLFGHVQALVETLPRLGTLQFASCDLWRPPHPSGTGSWRATPERRGSLWLEEPIHCLDLLAYVLEGAGPVTSITAWAAADDVLQARLEVGTQASALMTYALRAADYAFGMRVVGSRGAVDLCWRGATDVALHPTVSLEICVDGSAEQVPVPSHCGHAYDQSRLLSAFCATLRGHGVGPTPSAEVGVHAVALACAAERSVRTATPQALATYVASRGDPLQASGAA